MHKEGRLLVKNNENDLDANIRSLFKLTNAKNKAGMTFPASCYHFTYQLVRSFGLPEQRI